MKNFLRFFAFILSQICLAQSPEWTFSVDSVANLSSARAVDLNADGIKDIVFGAGADGIACNNGIMAVNGANGSLLWKRPARNEVFGSAVFQDVTSDGIPDVFISGRQAQLLAINGTNGQLIWDYFPYAVNPADSGLYNFYNPVLINDVTSDGINDILVSNGGDHAAPVWDTDRPAGRMMLIDASNGDLITEAIVPDSAEIYCSPVIADVWNDGNPWILYGTGGETLGGHFYACRLSNFIQGTLASSTVLAEDAELGFIAPASVVKETTGNWKIFIQGYNGTIHCIDGETFTPMWSTDFPGTESSAALALGQFTGSLQTDAFAVLYKGEASAYTDFYQVMLNGEDGSVQFIDSIGSLHFASANAIDINNDGLDEVLVSTNAFSDGGFRNSLQLLNFSSQSIQSIITPVAGVNLASTPLIVDTDTDSNLELFILTKRDSLNPSGTKGVSLRKFDLGINTPNSGISWGGYMGTSSNGHYSYAPQNCGAGSVISGFAAVNPSCNGLANGSLSPNLVDPNQTNTYLWSNGTVLPTLNGILAGTYTVRIANAAGCFEEISASLDDPYVISFGGTMPPTCPGDANGMATINSSGCVCMFSTCTFLWENGGTSKTNSQLTEGWNSVVINHPDGCVVSDSIFIDSPLPAIEGATVNAILCAGDANGSIELLPSQQYPPVNYVWSNGASSASLSGLIPGDYWVEVTDVRGCVDSLSFVVEDREPLQISASPINVSCSGLSNGGFSAMIYGGTAPFTWLVNDVVANNLQSTFAAGEYFLYALDANACVSNFVITTISEPEPLDVIISSTPEEIANTFSGTATAEVSGGIPPYGFAWSDPNSQSDSVAVFLNTGNYEVTVTDANGCSVLSSVWVDALSLGLQSDLQSEMKMSVFPNPTNGILNLTKEAEQLIVYDLLGQLIQVHGNCQSVSLDLLDAGFYVVEVLTKQETRRFVVQKVK